MTKTLSQQYDADWAPKAGCSASGHELRAMLWPLPEKKEKTVRAKTGRPPALVWKAAAYIILSCFTGGSAIAGSLAYTDELSNIYMHIEREITSAID